MGDEAKARVKRIIVDSIKDHLIPHVSSLKTPKGSVRCFDEAIEECKDPKFRDDIVILYKGLSNQRTT